MSAFTRWLLEADSPAAAPNGHPNGDANGHPNGHPNGASNGHSPEIVEGKDAGAYVSEAQVEHTHAWWKVMCLTGVDYFSTLGYQPGIAALAAGALAPFATLILVLLTLFGALPMYRRVAYESPHGDGSISMLETVLKWWQGKMFVLALIGFAATGFIITITLSAADAAAHVVENPFAPHFLENQNVAITLFLIALLGAVFLKGFGEAIGIAVGLVIIFIALNLVVVAGGFWHIFHHPELVSDWKARLFTEHKNYLAMFGASLLVFPALALGLSGFETGVVVMPLIRGDKDDNPNKPAGRIKNARKLLTTAASIMSVMLILSAVATTLYIPPAEFEAPQQAQPAIEFQERTETSPEIAAQDAVPALPAGKAYGRALAFMAHDIFGDGFGTAYDLSTIAILWFAGSSAMAGLLNIMPRYLPRYGMAPEWMRATRPLTLIFTAIAFIVTIAFHADVESQAGAYATGVLALMTSATVAVTLSAKRAGQTKMMVGFGIVCAIFVYTTVVTIRDDPGGLKIALIFIAGIIAISLLSRVYRTTELRAEEFNIDAKAQQIIDQAAKGHIRIVANHPRERDEAEYREKELEKRENNHIPSEDPIIFLEVTVMDASNFSGAIAVRGEERFGFQILRVYATTVPNAIAALLLRIRDETGVIPHVYFAWTEGNPLVYIFNYIVFGQGDVPPVTHEVLREAEPNPARRPRCHVGG